MIMLTTAQDLKKGSFINYEDKMYKVTGYNYKMGGGKMGGSVHLKIKDVKTGNVHETKLDPHDRIEELEIERHKMKYLYEDSSGLCFMDPQSFEQTTLSKEALSNLLPYLKEETEVEVEFFEGNPIHINLPEKIVLEVISTGAVKKGETDSVYKPARLEGDIEVLVPQFIKSGDKIYIDVETGEYADRVK